MTKEVHYSVTEHPKEHTYLWKISRGNGLQFAHILIIEGSSSNTFSLILDTSYGMYRTRFGHPPEKWRKTLSKISKDSLLDRLSNNGKKFRKESFIINSKAILKSAGYDNTTDHLYNLSKARAWSNDLSPTKFLEEIVKQYGYTVAILADLGHGLVSIGTDYPPDLCKLWDEAWPIFLSEI